MKHSNRKYLLITIILVIIACGIGFGTAILMERTSIKESPPPPTSNRILENQTAEIRGTITEVNGNMATVSNDSYVSATFPISPKVTFYSLGENNQVKALVGFSAIPIQQHVLVKLLMQNGQYQITEIFPQPPVAPTQAVAIPTIPIPQSTPQPTTSSKPTSSKAK